MTLKFPGVERGEGKHLSFLLRKSQAIDIDFRILVNKLRLLRGLGIDHTMADLSRSMFELA